VSKPQYQWSPGFGRYIKVETYEKPQRPAAKRAEQAKRVKRLPITETWAQVPHHRGLQLAKHTGNAVLAVLLALEIVIHKAKSNRVKLSNSVLLQYGISHQSKWRGLRLLEQTGAISIEKECSTRQAPVVTHHWYTAHGALKRS
jgi:hypothetical protein